MNRQDQNGFSLLELLAVICVVCVLAVFAVPAVADLMVSQKRTQALSEIVSLIELARNEAITTQRYAWIGFESGTDEKGNDELRAIVLSAKGGAIKTTGAGKSLWITSALPITREFRWPDLRLATLDDLTELSDMNAAPEPTKSIAQQTEQSFRLGGTGSQVVTMRSITFTPRGYALLEPLPKLMSPYIPFVDIGLQPTKAGKDIELPDQAAVILDGVSGRTSILRH